MKLPKNLYVGNVPFFEHKDLSPKKKRNFKKRKWKEMELDLNKIGKRIKGI